MFPFESIINLEKESRKPIYIQIAFAIINAIRNGVLKPGVPLPSTREMAKKLDVHRKTVIAAYEELIAQDWIQTVARKGVHVSNHIPQLKPKKWEKDKEKKSYQHALTMPFRVFDTKLPNFVKSPGLKIVIDDGYPDVKLSPIDTLLKSYRFIATKKSSVQRSLEDGAKGSLRLREQLSFSLAETRGINISKDNILITHGAQMSIYIAASLLILEKTNVIVGKPNYALATQVFSRLGAHVINVPVDEAGLDLDEVERICQQQRIGLVYVIPHHHYPTTVTLSVERRMKLLQLSRKYAFVIIEDDYDYDYHYDSSPYLPLASANHEGNVIYIGSFSKLLAPSIRMGFMVASENFIEQAAIFRRHIDVGGDMFMQDALAMLIAEGELKRHITKAKKVYHQRRDYLNTLIKGNLANYVSMELPGGGMAIWIKLDSKIPIRRLCEVSLKNGLRIKSFNEEFNAFRFGFASLSLPELREAVTILENGIIQVLDEDRL